MTETKQHYAEPLGPVYRWYVSAAGDPVARARSFLARHELDRGETYLDLGAGFGQHTLALLEARKRVTAVDFDEALLGELRTAARGLVPAPAPRRLGRERGTHARAARRGRGDGRAGVHGPALGSARRAR